MTLDERIHALPARIGNNHLALSWDDGHWQYGYYIPKSTYTLGRAETLEAAVSDLESIAAELKARS